AIYLLRMTQKVLFGPIVHERVEKLKDLSLREWAYMLPIIALCFGMGMFPGFFTDRIQPSVNRLHSMMSAEYDIYLYEHSGYEELLQEGDSAPSHGEEPAHDEHSERILAPSGEPSEQGLIVPPSNTLAMGRQQ
ncbi:MAG: hypothetical protein KC561_21165, partial [Myxococcales bacterium]|nr:hypothetical protein [Myxococcales bacterium]